MPIRVVRLGEPRVEDEGTRLGTVRRPPRGVRKDQYAAHDYFDVWMPDLAPSAPLVKWALSEPWTDARWEKYEKLYRREMKEPHARRLIEALAALSKSGNFSVGCYCQNPQRCHRAILADLLTAAGAEIAAASPLENSSMET